MDIGGMDLCQISRGVEKYVKEYFKSCALFNMDECLFGESNLFDFEEVKHLIPEKHHHLFKSTDKLNGISGIIEPDENEECEYTVTLIANEDYTKALLLCLQELEEKTVILKDFICS